MDKEKIAIDRLKTASELSLQYYKQPLVITDSGGKDSAVCLRLAQNAGIPYEVQHNHTTADAPETVWHVRETFRGLELAGVPCQINYPTYKGRRVSMWSLIPQKLMPPTRIVRYCCDVLKEQGGKNRFITTGVRWQESTRRKNERAAFESLPKNKEKKMLLTDCDDKRMLFENCQIRAKRVCNPIIDWTTDDVWDYIQDQQIKTNPLYCEFGRVGCIGCPMAGKHGREIEFARWPTYKQSYIRAFGKMLRERERRGKVDSTWRIGTGATDVFNWWMEYDILPGQIDIFEDSTEIRHSAKQQPRPYPVRRQ